MSSNISRVALITGCSSGIGKATARKLLAEGYTVFATARRISDVADLAALGARTLTLDVTDEPSMVSAVAAVEAEFGAVDVLVNNAGYGQYGAFESVPMDRVRKQFETNVFGTVRLTQLVLPKMRARGWGRIVNVGSMGGKLTLPGVGFYHATKYALEALTDALRFEVAGFGIAAILIEPGIIISKFAESASASAAPANDSLPYEAFNAAVLAQTVGAYEGPMAKLGGTAQDVANTIARALAAKKPRGRYTVSVSAPLMIGLRRLMTDSAWDGFAASAVKRPAAVLQAQ
jgi:NAD(P)-dependent dehydrogenase (short-subunit alcohol dehydrogenase family)